MSWNATSTGKGMGCESGTMDNKGAQRGKKEARGGSVFLSDVQTLQG